jgi:ABC-2 type transport system permease protein
MLDRVLAIAWLRFRTAIHAMRSGEGVLRVVSSVVITLIGGMFSIGLAIGFGTMAYFAAHSDDPAFLKITFVVVFFSCGFFGIFMPLLFAASGEGFDLRRLLIFPVSRGQVFGISLGSAFLGSEHLFYYPTLLAVSLTGIVLPGGGVIAGLAIVLVFISLVVAWSHAIMMLLQGLMRRRRSREIVVFLIFLVVVLASLTPVLMTPDESNDPQDEVDGLFDGTHQWIRVAEFLPPFIAASGLQGLSRGETARGLISMAWLLAWLVPGVAVGHFIFTRHILGDGGSGSGAAVRTAIAPARSDGFDATDLPIFSQQVIGVAVKELRYLLRSVVGKFNLVMTPVLALIVVFLVTRELPTEAFFGVDPEALALFGMLGYMTLFSNNFVNNAFAWEGAGVQLYFCGPLPLDKVLLGKNLGVWAFTCVTGLLAIVTWSAFRGLPDVLTLASALLAFACCVVAFTTVGNFASIFFPVPRDCSSMTNSPSGSAVIIGLGTLVFAIGSIAVVVIAPVALGYPALQPLAVGLLLGLVLLVYRWSLSGAAALMARRAEALVEALRG